MMQMLITIMIRTEKIIIVEVKLLLLIKNYITSNTTITGKNHNISSNDIILTSEKI